jgi:hypothetical protein
MERHCRRQNTRTATCMKGIVVLFLLWFASGCAIEGPTPSPVTPVSTATGLVEATLLTATAQSATSTPVVPTPTPTEAMSATSLPSQTPQETPVPPTATPTVCLNEAARPKELPSRQTPLEVRYISDGNLWIWTEGKTQAVQMSTTGDAGLFTFSPDGQVAVFARGEADSQQEVWTIRRDGAGLHRLLSAEQLHQWGSAPTTPDVEFKVDVDFIRWLSGHRLGVEIMRDYHGVGGCCESLGYWLMDVETGTISSWTPPVEITTTPYGLVSPDGSMLAVLGDGGVNLKTRDGWLLHTAALPYVTLPAGEGTGRSYPQVFWAADSQSLGAVTFTADYFSDQATFTTWRVPVDGSPAVALATFTGSPYMVQVSPDLQYIIYTRMDAPNSNERTLHLATFDGKQDLAYAQGEGMEGLGWAPDGFHFLFWQNTTYAPPPQLGSLCGGSQSLLEPSLFPIRDIEWVDATHFLFDYGAYGDPNAELRLGEVGGASILIGKYVGTFSYYQFVPDDAALGK